MFAQILQDELSRRKRRRPSYSLRAFARDLAIQHGTLSQLLAGARRHARLFGWTVDDRNALGYRQLKTIASATRARQARRPRIGSAMPRPLLLGAALLASACSRPMSDADYARFAGEAVERLKAKQAWLEPRIDGYEHFDWNQGSRQLVFSSPDRNPVVAEVDFVGDVSARSNTWLWAWDNPSVEEVTKAASRRVRDLGRARRIPRLTLATWPATEADGWEMAAIAADVLRAQAAYRTKEDDGGATFMVLHDLRPAPAGFTVDHSGHE